MKSWTRRDFVRATGLAGGLTSIIPTNAKNMIQTSEKIKIIQTGSDFEREPLIRPFGFKGGYMSEIWQTIAWLKSDSGFSTTGLCSQSVLWSDASVFSSYSEGGGNALMYAMTEYALKLIKEIPFTSPVDLLDKILDKVYEYGKKITDNPHLRKTFALNALVAIDIAAWKIYASENGLTTFDEIIPAEYKSALSYRHSSVASIPLMAYTIPVSEIKQAADDGYFFMKIKIGQPGTQKEMLEKDMARLSEIHSAIGNYRTEHTKDGKLPYYFDANGRYMEKDTLMKLIDHTKKIGAFEQIAIIEEPFPEHAEIDVSDIPVRLAADESAHTDKDARVRIQMGYSAIALKAIAKTLSMTLKIAHVAKQEHVPCFCADLTVNPILVDWNKNVAARLDPFPGLGTGLLETNGHQNYENWTKMESYHPFPGSDWRKTKAGIFHLDEEFYLKAGGVLADSEHYLRKFEKV
ncbi:L-alanine-DL-glutamate epimerase [Maribellus comscasis]|uniref:L-alanine-DL-glutamate epimerase n=1 Tax=Maribellus comscasis TaxID=2681766 RepID=A0A6I6JXF8_9BACT|nr:enolase C-terminal domain-like protein [Maribellus comscasis]QGY43813.1 L-alanine-DL-glutamate epimerase [Maribellus comscasis]